MGGMHANAEDKMTMIFIKFFLQYSPQEYNSMKPHACCYHEKLG